MAMIKSWEMSRDVKRRTVKEQRGWIRTARAWILLLFWNIEFKSGPKGLSIICIMSYPSWPTKGK